MELIDIMAMHLCDADLCSLARVSRYMAAVVSPIYFRRCGLILSPRGHSLSTRSKGFKALGIWRRSLGLPSLPRLHCSFDFGSRQVALKNYHLREFFTSLPLQRTPFSHHVHLNYPETSTLQNSLDLLRDTIFMTRCQGVTMTALAFEDARSGWKTKKAEGGIVLSGLQELTFIHCQLSQSQWINFFTKLVIPSLQALKFTGETSMAAVYDFLVIHCDIRSLHFEKCSSKDMPTSPCPLKLRKLQSLQGTLSQTQHLLRTLLSPPPLKILVIEPDPAATVRHDNFVDNVMDCLAKCNELQVLEIRHSKEDDIAELTVLTTHISALAAATVSYIGKLSISFEDDISDEVLRVCNFPHPNPQMFTIYRPIVRPGWHCFPTSHRLV